MNKTIVTILVLAVLAWIVIGGFVMLPGSPFSPGNNVEAARATAQQELLQARATPLSDAAVVGIRGFEEMSEQHSDSMDAVVKVAVSGDAAQTSIAWAGTMNGFIAPCTLVGAGLVIIGLYLHANRKRNEG